MSSRCGAWGWISLELRRSKCLHIPRGTPQFTALSTPRRALKEFVSFPAITVSFVALISTGGGASEHGNRDDLNLSTY